MKIEIIVALIGLGGVAFASFLGGFGYFLRTRSERLESRRVVLFYLLEIRHAFLANMFEPKDVLKQYLAYCDDFFKKNGIVGDGDIPEEIKSLLLNHFIAVRDFVQQRLEEEIVSPFINALNELAKQAPIMAFKIRGKESISKLILLQNSYADGIQKAESISAIPILSKVMDAQIDNLKNTNISELNDELNQVVKMVARSCGPISYFECRKILKKEVKSEIDFSEMGLDENLKGFMKALKEAVTEAEISPTLTL